VEKLLEETAEARTYQEEVSQMLAGQLSNQDEDEVEDELEALEHELAGPVRLPDAPTAVLPENIPERDPEVKAKERARARAKARAAAAAPLEA
jgi:charged multivesicular body protein 6